MDWDSLLSQYLFIGGTVERFWNTTLRDFQLETEAFAEREHYEMTKLARHASWIMNMWTKKGKQIKATDLVPKRTSKSIGTSKTSSDIKEKLKENKKFFDKTLDDKDSPFYNLNVVNR